MRWLSIIKARLSALVHRDAVLDDIDAEMRSHVEMETEANMERGLKPEEARLVAARSFGNLGVFRDLSYDIRGGGMLETFWQDLRYGVRMLLKQKGFTTVAVLSLALGIGANTALFSVIDALMFKQLQVRQPEQLVMFYVLEPGSSSAALLASYKEFQRYRALTEVFADVSAIGQTDRFNVVVNGPDGGLDAGLVRVALVSGNYFSMLGVDPLMGRTLTPDDDRAPGGHPVVVISYDYWDRKFARASNVLGRTLTLNGITYTILGVTKRGFSGEWIGRPTDLWIPTMMEAQVMPEYPALLNGNGVWVRLIGRLKPGATIEQAQAAAQIVRQQVLREGSPNPTASQAQHIAQTRMELKSAVSGYSPMRDSLAPSLAILMIMVGVVLLIACVNITNLLLARAATRQREFMVRRALGAGTYRIARQLLTESILLAVMGGALGFLFTVWGTTAFSKTISLGPVQMDSRAPSQWITLDLHPDWRVFAFTALLCLVTGIMFGLAPAFRGSRASLSSALTGRGADSGSSGGKFTLGKVLVISQVALSLVLLIGAGLFLRTLHNLKSVDLGIDRQHVLLVWTAPGQTGRQGPALANLVQTAQERTSSLPGVLSASASSSGLITGTPESSGGPSEDMRVEGQQPKSGLLGVAVQIAPRYFETLGVPVLWGRDFTDRDTETSPQVAIINETMARFFFGNQNPIGKHFGWIRDVGMPIEIVGVVKDLKFGTPRERKIQVFYPYRQRISYVRSMCFVVRSTGNPLSIATRVRQELRDLDPNLPVLKIDTIEEQLNDVLMQERLRATLSSFFGVLAVLLAGLGIFGVISYAVSRRTNEIGIRLALGAKPSNVQLMVLKETLLLTLVGVAIGVPVTLAATRLISTKLFGVSASDPVTIFGATVLMISVGALAALLPAHRASRVDPLVALRYE